MVTDGGSGPHGPSERYPDAVYSLLSELLRLDAVRSMSYFGCLDIGVIRCAYLELYVGRGLRQHEPFSRAIRLFDQGGLAEDVSRPQWADVADWYDEGPLKGDLHVADGDRGADLIERNWSEEPKVLLLLPPLRRRPVGSALRHRAYKWYWNAADLSLGVNEQADVALKIVIDRLAQSRGLERVAST